MEDIIRPVLVMFDANRPRFGNLLDPAFADQLNGFPFDPALGKCLPKIGLGGVSAINISVVKGRNAQCKAVVHKANHLAGGKPSSTLSPGHGSRNDSRVIVMAVHTW